ncbi:holin, partial [Listeria monocytogenes]|nr:holin [Listeria monocytogenes]
MKLTNKQYDFAKTVITQWSPALAVLIAGVATLYGWDATKIVGLISLVTAFAG